MIVVTDGVVSLCVVVLRCVVFHLVVSFRLCWCCFVLLSLVLSISRREH